MQEIEIVTLEDNQEYNVITKIELNGFTYLILANTNDDTDMCVRKEIVKEDKSYLAMLSSDEELENVLKEFAKE